MISDKFHLAEFSYPDGDEDGVVTVTNLCMLESGCDLGNLMVPQQQIVDDAYKVVEAKLQQQAFPKM
eukprot:2674191-Amphidinium_carterae.1